MIDSLSYKSYLYHFIKYNYNLPILVSSKEIEGIIISNFKFTLPLNIKKISTIFPTLNLSNAGIYIFKHSTGKFALGSAMNFERRIIDHVNSFRGHRTMQKLHKFTIENGGLNSITWGPLVITPNFLNLFISTYPFYNLNKLETQILAALTQFIPRILEQSYMSYYKPELNGSKNKIFNIIFSFTKWDNKVTDYLDISKSNNNYIALDEDKIIVASSTTMNGLASKLGLSLNGLKYHLNHDSLVYSKYLKFKVSISKKGTIPKGKPITNHITKKIAREILNLNNISLYSLELGAIYAYALDKKTVITKGKSAPTIFKYINPTLSLNLDSRTLKSKADNMATYINKELIYFSELGKFFLAKNPHYSINAKIPIIVIDIKLDTATYYNGKRECARALSKIFNSKIQIGTFSRNDWIDSGKLIYDKLILVTKPQFLNLIPSATYFNNGTINIKAYKVNFIDHKYTLNS